MHTFQKCIQNRPSTHRGQEKQLFRFLSVFLPKIGPIQTQFRSKNTLKQDRIFQYIFGNFTGLPEQAKFWYFGMC